MVKEYEIGVSSGATGRLACLDTGGNFRADEMAFDPRDNLLIVANDADGFLPRWVIHLFGKSSPCWWASVRPVIESIHGRANGREAAQFNEAKPLSVLALRGSHFWSLGPERTYKTEFLRCHSGELSQDWTIAPKKHNAEELCNGRACPHLDGEEIGSR
jgi:hypothetical protein